MSIKHFLAIETSCDETAIAILRQTETNLEILASEVSSQVALHAQWGGVVPNLAAREHVQNISPLLNSALKKAGLNVSDITALAVTNGPGLIPALLVGVNFAKTLSYLWNKPLLGIHHIEGHIYANFIGDKISAISNDQFPTCIAGRRVSKQNELQNSTSIEFPILCLVVSGGHTQLVLMREHLQYEIIGQTLDDAVGEAFDKVARILDIGYPGGPAVSAYAETASSKLQVPSSKISLPRPMLNKNNFDFSFSGLKTAVLYETKKLKEQLPITDYQLLIPEICHEFQQAAIDVLVAKTVKAAKQFSVRTVMLAGGVSANIELRKQLGEKVTSQLPLTDYRLPMTELTGDNAAMIAAAAAFRWEKMSAEEKQAAQNAWRSIQTDANLKLL